MDVSSLKVIRELLKGRSEELETWIESGRSFTTPSGKKTPLEVAIEAGFHSLVELLLRHEIDQEAKNQRRRIQQKNYFSDWQHVS